MKQALSTVIILIGTLCTQPATSQEQLRISGIVKDAHTSNPLEYAHVGLLNTAIGTVTNTKGEFSLIVPAFQEYTMVFTYLGYENKSIQFSEIGQTKVLEIRLNPSAINLPELIISSRKRNIIEEAIEAIPLNHDLNDLMLSGFFRAQIKDDSDYVQLSETAFEIYRLGAEAKSTEKKSLELKILKGRISRDSLAFDSLQNFQAGVTPKGLFSASFLINSSILSKKTIKKHYYEIADITSHNGRTAYVVKFNKKDKEKNGWKGTVILDTETLAFINIDYFFSPDNEEDIMLFGDAKLAGKISGLAKSTYDNNRTVLNFQSIDGKWYLSHAVFEAEWTLIKQKQDYSKNLKYYADFVVTDIQKGNYEIPEKEEFAKSKILENQINYSDADFWRDFNIILPDQDFDLIFSEINERNKKYTAEKAALE